MTPEIILGPPGTGKTTKLLSLVDEELSRGTPPDRIGYVSFTKQAANEAMTRACEKFKLKKHDFKYFRTLHSLCFTSMGLSNSDVFEGKKIVDFGNWLGVELSEHKRMDDGLLMGFTQGDRALFMENLSRIMCVDLKDLYDRDCDGLPWVFVERIARGLKQYKYDNQLIDYTDMLVMFAETQWSPQLDVLFVDEAQDLSALQWRVVWKLSKTCSKVVIAGDDDQAIYRWAGAAVDDFVYMSGSVTVLDKSWRVPKVIQSVSENIISRVTQRRDKQWAPRESKGELDRLSRFDDLDLSGDDILILARNAFVLRDIENMLKSDGVLYNARGHNSVRPSIINAIITWEKLRSGQSVQVSDVRNVYDYMSSSKGVKRGFKTLPSFLPDQLVNIQELFDAGGLIVNDLWHDSLDRIPAKEMAYMLKARNNGEKLLQKPRIRLSTIHGSKGSEAEHVVLIRDMANRTYQEMNKLPEDEARVWYVAATRAKQKLSLIRPKTNMSYDI